MMQGVARTQVLDLTRIIGAIASGFPGFPGILKGCFSTNGVYFPTTKGDGRGLKIVKTLSEFHWLLFGGFP